MTDQQLGAIREDRKTMTMVQIAAKYGITRQRVHQILTRPDTPPEKRRAFHRAGGAPISACTVVRFRHRRTQHLNDPSVQESIRKAVVEGGNPYHLVAQAHRCSLNAVKQIMAMTVLDRPEGRRPKPGSKEERERLAAGRKARTERNQAILQDWPSMTLAELAVKYKLSKNYIWRICKKAGRAKRVSI